jgi:hypothetical protein
VVEKLADCTILYGKDREEDSEAGDPSAVSFPSEDGDFYWNDPDLAAALLGYRLSALEGGQHEND